MYSPQLDYPSLKIIPGWGDVALCALAPETAAPITPMASTIAGVRFIPLSRTAALPPSLSVPLRCHASALDVIDISWPERNHQSNAG